MKIKVVSHREEIEFLEPGEKYLHLAFRPCVKDFFIIKDRCPKLEFIQLPHSYMIMLAKSLKPYFAAQRIKLLEGTVWGHRKDLFEYYETPAAVPDKIKGMLQQGTSHEEITHVVSKDNKISPDLANFMVLESES